MISARYICIGNLTFYSLILLGCNERKRDPKQWPASHSELITDASTDATDVAAELTYRRYCIGCHGDDGRGNRGTTGADLTSPTGPLASRSDAELVISVRDGKQGKSASMPAHKPVLKDAQIEAVVRYLRARFDPRITPKSP